MIWRGRHVYIISPGPAKAYAPHIRRQLMISNAPKQSELEIRMLTNLFQTMPIN